MKKCDVMTTQTSSSRFREWLKNPLVAGILLVVYIVAAIVILVLVDRNRSNILFPLYSTLAFPPLVLAPFVIMATSLSWRYKGLLILLLLVVAIPIVGLENSSYLEIAIQICLYSGLALGLNIVVGFAGLLDLGYVAFFAVGAYLWASFTSNITTIFFVNHWIVPEQNYWMFYIFIVLAVVAAALVGILLGLPVLRLRGDYLAIVTLGFGEMIRVLVNNLDQPYNLTNGPRGLSDVGSPPLAPFIVNGVDGVAKLLHLEVANLQPTAQQILFYFITIVVLGVIILVVWRLQNSPIGRAWAAIREDEIAAIAMGVPLVRMKLLAFASGAAFAGAIGVIYAAKQSFVSPESFSLIQSISILAMVIVGGMGNIRGVILGATIVTLLNLQVLTNFALLINNLKNINYVVPILNFNIADWPAQLTPDKYQRFVFGILLVTMMIFRPAGLLPSSRRLELRQAKVAKQTGGEA